MHRVKTSVTKPNKEKMSTGPVSTVSTAPVEEKPKTIPETKPKPKKKSTVSASPVPNIDNSSPSTSTVTLNNKVKPKTVKKPKKNTVVEVVGKHPAFYFVSIYDFMFPIN